MKYSKYQQAIFDTTETNETNNTCVAINAVAGSGKTATGVELCNRKQGFGRYMAFNKHIAEELRRKLLFTVESMTYNAFGNSILRDHLPRYKVSDRKDANLLRYFVLKDRDPELYWTNVGVITRLISLFKAHCCFTVAEAKDKLAWLQARHDIEDCNLDLLFETYDKSIKDYSYVSFDDQKFLPLLLGLDIPRSDYLVIDEAQDTCDVEMELMLRSSDIVYIFGDPMQCIYSFKGTTPDAMDVFVERMCALQLPLSICYRCSQAVVREAQKIYDAIEPWEESPEGDVRSGNLSEAVPGDMVLARCTADLVQSCLNFIREGVPAYVKGREVGDKLIRTIDRVQLLHGKFDKQTLRLWEKSEYDKNKDNDAVLLRLSDTVETLEVLIGNDRSVGDIKNQIERLFTEGFGIAHMTIHKSKGLQAKRVFLFRKNLPHPRSKQTWQREEECRLEYVAITRAEEELIYV